MELGGGADSESAAKDERLSSDNAAVAAGEDRLSALPDDILDIDDYQYVMEDMTMLPDITILHLNILANRHAFGASAFHVLRMCSGIRKLMLEFLAPTVVDAETICPPGCICGEHQNWETEPLLLNHLKEVVITGMRGSEHEVTFVKQLFIWGTDLEKMTVFVHPRLLKS